MWDVKKTPPGCISVLTNKLEPDGDRDKKAGVGYQAALSVILEQQSRIRTDDLSLKI